MTESKQDRIDIAEETAKWTVWLEARLGLHVSAVVFGLLLIAVAAVYVTPALEPINHGVGYRRLSVDPLGFQRPNPLQYRILSRLIAHWLFLRGDYYILFPLLTGLAFLSAIFIYFRRRDFGIVESIGVSWRSAKR